MASPAEAVAEHNVAATMAETPNSVRENILSLPWGLTGPSAESIHDAAMLPPYENETAKMKRPAFAGRSIRHSTQIIFGKPKNYCAAGASGASVRWRWPATNWTLIGAAPALPGSS